MRYPTSPYIYIYPLRDYIGYLIPSFPTDQQYKIRQAGAQESYFQLCNRLLRTLNTKP